MSLPKLEITAPGGMFHDGTVKIDGWEVPGLKRLTVNLDVGSINEVELTIAVDEVHISAEALLKLHAIVDEQEGGA